MELTPKETYRELAAKHVEEATRIVAGTGYAHPVATYAKAQVHATLALVYMEMSK